MAPSRSPRSPSRASSTTTQPLGDPGWAWPLLVGLDLARITAASDRTLAQFVDGLLAEGHDRPGRKPGAGRLGEAIDRALDGLARVRAERQRRLDYLGALIDTVSASVLVLGEGGRLEFANRAARQRLGEAAHLGVAWPGLGPAAATACLRPKRRWERG